MIPNNYKELTLLHGVGPKIANLCKNYLKYFNFLTIFFLHL